MKKLLSITLIIFLMGLFTMPAHAADISITVFVNPGGSISGGDATVTATGNGVTKTATSDHNTGMCNISLPAGTYTFTATKGGSTGTITQAVSSSQTTVSISFSSTASGNATITVQDQATNSPIGNEPVNLTGNGVSKQVTTTTSGQASFTNIPTGTYTISALEMTNYNSASGSVTITSGATAAATLKLAPKSTSGTGNITIFINPGNVVSGATVSVTVNGQTKTATSDSAGQAQFTALPAGTYTFMATAARYNSGSASLTVYQGANNGTINMTPQLGNATITVLDKTTNKPFARGVPVNLTGNGLSQQVITNANGVAAFNNIQVGTYTFSTLAPAGYVNTSVNATIGNNTTVTSTINIPRVPADTSLTVKLHFPSIPSGQTYQVGFLKAEGGSWESNSVGSISSDQTVKVPASGNYRFYARWLGRTGIRYTMTDVINITTNGATYNTNNLFAHPANITF